MKKLTLKEWKSIETESRKVTKACRAGKKLPAKRYSAKAKEVVAAIQESDFCTDYQEDTKRILQAVMGISLPPIVSDDVNSKFFVRHAVVVCEKNPNSHSYGRKPVLVHNVGNDYEQLRSDGTVGNHLPTPKKSHIRYATSKEVTAFFAVIRKRIKAGKSVDYRR